MRSDPTIDTVLFDVGGTILRVQPSVGEIYAERAAAHGQAVPPAEVTRRFRTAWKHSVERSRARGYRTSDEILRREWLAIVRETFGELVDPAGVPRLFEDLYACFISARAWVVVPGVRETLAHLRSRGLRLGVLSNWDSRLRPLLAELGLDEHLDFIVVSHEVGFEKPHPAMFEQAIRLSGSHRRRIVHVGDSYHADIAPARALELRTLWIAPSAERALEPHGGPGLDSLPEDPEAFWESLGGTNLA
ncbi:MAG: HAD-IA family hydrolase [Planctomycetes bacterium]|nr:HAD-IA family hydrolase [Planctomycetota bacterium]